MLEPAFRRALFRFIPDVHAPCDAVASQRVMRVLPDKEPSSWPSPSGRGDPTRNFCGEFLELSGVNSHTQ